VIGRTYSEPHKYFYRRYARQMWTSWEPVSAEIDGDHLAPVVWRDRLYLFWVTFIEKPEPPAPDSSSNGLRDEPLGRVEPGRLAVARKEQKLTDMTLSQATDGVMKGAGKRTVEAHLHWSEYLQGEWSTRESGGLGAPSPVVVTGLWSFSRNDVIIHVSKEPYDNDEERGVYIHLGGAIGQAFYLAGRNSPPEKAGYSPTPANPYSASEPRANRYSGLGPLAVSFKRRITTEDGHPPVDTVETPGILREGGSHTVVPCDNDITLGTAGVASDLQALMKPWFYQDNALTLLAQPTVAERTIEEWQEWVTHTPQPDSDTQRPQWWTDVVVTPQVPLGTGAVLAHPRSDWLANSETGLLFDGEVIGPIGRAGRELKVVGSGGLIGRQASEGRS
jgi:hypothetical protein